MPISIGQPVYYNLNETKPETMLVSKGEFCGSQPSPKYPTNTNHNFFEITGEKRHVVLSGGQLKYMANQGTLQVGKVYDIIFKGKKTLDSGNYAGSKVSDFEVLEYSKKEVADLVEAGAELRNAPADTYVPHAEDMPKVVETASAETLGDLR